MELTDNRVLTKKAKADHEILDLLADRYSPRSFDQREVEDDTLYRLFEAMRWAPSSMNEQPWRIIYARRGEKAYEKMAETLKPGNKSWAEKAPVLMLTMVKTTFANGTPNRSAKHDLGLAIANFTLQATHEGIGLHQMGGFSPEKAKELFQIPEEYELVTAVALGYYGNPENLPEAFREREIAERSRKPVSEFAFHEHFNR